jgi:uncharacterized protein YggT (Ycf19 family)
MSATDSFLTHWYFHLPNLFLAALMYTLLGRLILSLVFPAGSQAVLWRVFCQVTDPVLRLVGALTPRMVPPVVVLAFAIVWCLFLRMVLLIGLAGAGLVPRAA